jgi:hypothetical protein
MLLIVHRATFAANSRDSGSVSEKNASVDGLGGTLNIYGLGFVMVVLWTSVRFKEMKFEILKTAPKVRFKLPVTGAIDIALQAIQIVARVKVVDPVVFGRLSIKPRAVGILTRTAIGHGVSRQLASLLIIGVDRNPREQRRPQHVRVVNRTLLEGDVTETSPAARPLSRQTLHPLSCTRGHVQILGIARHFVGFQKGQANQAAPDNCRHMLGYGPSAR